MPEQTFDCAIVGGGIVGLATGMAVLRKMPGVRLVILEKESDLAEHQTGRNSGVIHSGIYYKPGSYKAKFARAGSRSMVEFCQEHGIKHDICGKIIVATEEWELPLLENLFQRGLQNSLDVSRLSVAQAKEIEPHVSCRAAVKVPTTGIVSYREVSRKYAEIIRKNGGVIRFGVKVDRIRTGSSGIVLETNQEPVETRFIVNCAGLHSDRVAREGGLDPGAKIVPFRGEYYELTPDAHHLVKGLIYPVPNPDFPFLGVHFTRMIEGGVHAGPNAVLAFKREGYHKTDFSLRDFTETMTFPGFWKLARKHLSDGIMEMRRSLSKKLFLKSLQRLIPEVRAEHLVPSHAGVRAQALMPDGKLVDDFLFLKGENSLHVCNAPSSAATASLEIGQTIAEQLPNLRTAVGVAV